MTEDSYEKEILVALRSIRDLLAQSLELQSELKDLTRNVLKE